jgi:hypothetical protein
MSSLMKAASPTQWNLLLLHGFLHETNHFAVMNSAQDGSEPKGYFSNELGDSDETDQSAPSMPLHHTVASNARTPPNSLCSDVLLVGIRIQ